MNVNGLDSIDTLYAFIAVDATGEGIMGFQTADGTWMPMIGADLARIESLRPLAQEAATASNKRIVIAHFTTRTDQEVIEP